MREIDRLSQIVDELLILSRAGEHELPGERLDLAAAARRAAERWRGDRGGARDRARGRGGGGRGRRLVRRPGPRPLDRRPGRERAALLAAGLDGDDRRRARAGSRSSTAGPGLAAGEEEAVFERFSRGSAGRRGPSGTGLGLPIARELTRQWGGDVTPAPTATAAACALSSRCPDEAARRPSNGSASPCSAWRSPPRSRSPPATSTSQQIGIASESITAGDTLAPAVRSASRRQAFGQPKPPWHDARHHDSCQPTNHHSASAADGPAASDDGPGPVERLR